VAKRLAKRFHCLTEFTLSVLEGKWKSAILFCLVERPVRYTEMRVLLPGLSDKMLSERLRDLAGAGLVKRQRVTGRELVQVYTLTPLGRSLGTVLKGLSSWATEHVEDFGVHISNPFDAVEHDQKEPHTAYAPERPDDATQRETLGQLCSSHELVGTMAHPREQFRSEARGH
jgi:DNA-binding HxlR family transcriptional regulator